MLIKPLRINRRVPWGEGRTALMTKEEKKNGLSSIGGTLRRAKRRWGPSQENLAKTARRERKSFSEEGIQKAIQKKGAKR